MAFSLVPDRVFHSVLDIKGADLVAQGIRLLLADLDNTLVRYGQEEISPEVMAWRDELEANGVTLYLLSNSRKPLRPKAYAQQLNIPYIGHAGKPKRGGFQKAMEQMGRAPSQTAMVGDQIFTDILGAKRSGMRAFLVKPMELAGNPGRYIRYGIETPCRLLGRMKK